MDIFLSFLFLGVFSIAGFVVLPRRMQVPFMLALMAITFFMLVFNAFPGLEIESLLSSNYTIIDQRLNKNETDTLYNNGNGMVYPFHNQTKWWEKQNSGVLDNGILRDGVLG